MQASFRVSFSMSTSQVAGTIVQVYWISLWFSSRCAVASGMRGRKFYPPDSGYEKTQVSSMCSVLTRSM